VVTFFRRRMRLSRSAIGTRPIQTANEEAYQTDIVALRKRLSDIAQQENEVEKNTVTIENTNATGNLRNEQGR
jgi:hypothetical protein